MLFRIHQRERKIEAKKAIANKTKEKRSISLFVEHVRMRILQRWYCVRCHSVAVRHFIDKSACSLSCTDKKLIIHRQMRFDKKINDILVTAAGSWSLTFYHSWWHAALNLFFHTKCVSFSWFQCELKIVLSAFFFRHIFHIQCQYGLMYFLFDNKNCWHSSNCKPFRNCHHHFPFGGHHFERQLNYKALVGDIIRRYLSGKNNKCDQNK